MSLIYIYIYLFLFNFKDISLLLNSIYLVGCCFRVTSYCWLQFSLLIQLHSIQKLSSLRQHSFLPQLPVIFFPDTFFLLFLDKTSPVSSHAPWYLFILLPGYLPFLLLPKPKYICLFLFHHNLDLDIVFRIASQPHNTLLLLHQFHQMVW